MLTKIREKVQGILAFLLLGFLAIPFALWGIGSYFEGGSQTAVAEVNGVEISQQTYQQALDNLRRASGSQAEGDVLKRLTLENLIGQTLIMSQAHESGYRTSDPQLARMIRQLPYFQRDGRFDPALYRAMLRRQGLSPAAFEEQLRQESLPSQLQAGLSQSAFVTEADVARAVRLLRQERRASYAVIDADAFVVGIEIEPQVIEQYYRANPEMFRAPEAVRVAYLTLDASALGSGIEPTEEELRRAYEAEAARYVTPERRRVSHILIEMPAEAQEAAAEAARAEAEKLRAELRAGADFAALAKEHSDDLATAAKGGDLGVIQRGVLPAELEQAVFALKPGEVSAPVRTEFGYHLAKLVEHTPERRRPYEAVKAELAERVRTRKGQEEFYERAERFRNLVYENPQDLKTTAERLGLTVQTSDWFTRAGGSGIAADPQVVEAAFEPEVLHGERNSDALELEGERLLALRVVDHRPSEIRPLEEVRADIERRLKQERARKLAREKAAQWVAEIEQGKTLQQLARGPGVSYHADETLTRAEPGDVVARLADALFAAPRPEGRPVVGQVDLGAQGYAVYALEAVKDVDLGAVDDAFKEQVRRRLLQRRGADYYLSYRQNLRQTADIEINEAQL